LSGTTISIILKEEKKELKPFDFAVKIIYEDDDVIVVDKPSGLVVHPPQEGYNQTLVNALIYLKKELSPSADNLRPGVVHRLDKETSGVIVLTKMRIATITLLLNLKHERFLKSIGQ